MSGDGALKFQLVDASAARDFARLFRTTDGKQILARVHDDDEGLRIVYSARMGGATVDMGIDFGNRPAEVAFDVLDEMKEDAGDKIMAQIHQLTGGAFE